MKTLRISIAAFIWLLFIKPSYSCMSFTPDDSFLPGSATYFLVMPEGNFLYEISRITGKPISQYQDKEDKLEAINSTADADIADLKQALDNLVISEKEKQVASQAYADVRLRVRNYLKENPMEEEESWSIGQFRAREVKKILANNIQDPKNSEKIKKLVIDYKFPSVMPEEFTLYTQGAIEYHNNNLEAAVYKWKKLLSLPKDKRQFKSTWTSFMIGKAYLAMRKQKEAILYFEMTRQLALDGFKDSLSLSESSQGWQALAEFELKDYVSSLKNYFKVSDVNSLRFVCSDIDCDDSVFEQIVKDDVASRIAIGYRNFCPKFMEAMEKFRPKAAVDNADRMAWIYYLEGDMPNVSRWLKISEGKSALSKFIAAKMMLRDGKVDEALAALNVLVPLFEKNNEQKVFLYGDTVMRDISNDIGLLRLSRKEYLAAFDVLLKSKYWNSIAYVAELVLTSEEFENYLKEHKTDASINEMSTCSFTKTFFKFNDDGDRSCSRNKNEPDTLYQSLEYLLARKFAREEKWHKAIAHMPIGICTDDYEQISPKALLHSFAKSIDKGNDNKFSNKERAQDYYDAAVILQKYGMEIIGTETDPDNFADRGGFESCLYCSRFYKRTAEELELEKKMGLRYSEDERRRVLASRPKPDKRFHYRYKAADLMWKASELLPGNDELKARVLCEGGRYIQKTDLKLADKFYKALAKTCSGTELGKQAYKLRWFPKQCTDL